MAMDIHNVSAEYRQAGAGAAQTAAEPDNGAVSAAGMALLIVDDDPALTEQLRSLVEAKGCQALTASSGEEALRLYSSHAGGFAMLVADPRLPGMRGRAMIEALMRLQPQSLLLVVPESAAEAAYEAPGRSVPLLRQFLRL